MLFTIFKNKGSSFTDYSFVPRNLNFKFGITPRVINFDRSSTWCWLERSVWIRPSRFWIKKMTRRISLSGKDGIIGYGDNGVSNTWSGWGWICTGATLRDFIYEKEPLELKLRPFNHSLSVTCWKMGKMGAKLLKIG